MGKTVSSTWLGLQVRSAKPGLAPVFPDGIRPNAAISFFVSRCLGTLYLSLDFEGEGGTGPHAV